LPLSPGDRFDRYEILARLGGGGMGEIYRAHDARLQRDVALKILRDRDGATDPSGAERILREARSAAALEHPNVVAVYDVGERVLPGETGGTPYIAMELIKGRSLRECVGDLSTPLAERVRWLTDIARALGAAHKAGLVHRDVKPDNVMLRDDGVIKVLDFGVAKRSAPSAIVSPTLATAGGALSTLGPRSRAVGTPFYMSPEQLRSERLDGRADQFSWGVMAYELLTGRPPWISAGDLLQLVAEIQSDDPAPLRSIDPQIPPELEALVLRALSKSRSARFPSMDQLAEALAAAAPPPPGARRVAPKTSVKPPSPRDKLRTREDDSELAARAQARVGKVLRGKYTVDAVLGIGGMAVVYAVTHRNRKRFALKLLHPERGGEIKERFLREGYVANTVNHPGAVAVLDDDTAEDGGAFLVMELLEGKNVEELWDGANGRLPPRVVAWIADQLLDVLSAAHARGIVHRDVKPANLFLTRDGKLKVLDFGIARLRESSDAMLSTSTGVMLGTPAFMAPEQASGRHRDVDARTDVWAVGATMFTLLTGQIVHEADNAQALLVAAATAAPRKVAPLAPETPPALCEVIDRALARSSEDRWPSASAMREALQAAHVAAFDAPVSRDAVDVLVQSTLRMHVPPTTPLQRLAPDSPTLAAATSGDAPEPRHVITSPNSRSVNPQALTEVVVGTAMSTARPLSWHPAAGTTARQDRGGRALRVGMPAALIALVVAGGYATLHSRVGHTPEIGASTTVPGPAVVQPSASAEPSPSAQEVPAATASTSSPVASVSQSVAPVTTPTPNHNKVQAGTAAPVRTAPPATTEDSQGCFYFDPQVKRLVARPGCR
jgi:serine/threonine-protein kinase